MSTEDKKTCPKCGKPIAECTCPKETPTGKPEGEHIYVHHEHSVIKTGNPEEKDPKVTDPKATEGDKAGEKSGDKKTDDKTDDKAGEKTGDKAGEKKEPVAPVKSVEELTAELEKEKKKREEYEAIIGAEAVKTFENEKNEFLKLIPDETKRKEVADKIGDDPDRLEEYKRTADFLASALKVAGVKITGEKEVNEEETKVPPPPAGKVGLPPAKTGTTDYKTVVDELYNILLDPSKTDAERKEANRKVDELFSELVKGLRQHPSTKISISQCPQCGGLLNADAESCVYCGWKHVVKR